MTEKYKNRYRIASARAAWWSYGWAGAYFITICTKNRQHFFGRITRKSDPIPGRDKACLVSTVIGELAQRFWYEIPYHARSVELGAFKVMPNHIHGILILGDIADAGVTNGDAVTENDLGPVPGRDKACLVSTIGIGIGIGNEPEPEQTQKSQYHPRFQNQGKNTVSSIIGGYKSAVTKHAHQSGFVFDWQFSFHDRIIRDDKEYQRINDYIEANPQRWLEDRFFH